MKRTSVACAVVVMLLASIVCLPAACAQAPAHDQAKAKDPPAPMKPEDTEQWTPVPVKVMPGASDGAAPSDAIVLFDGRNLDQWVMAKDR